MNAIRLFATTLTAFTLLSASAQAQSGGAGSAIEQTTVTHENKADSSQSSDLPLKLVDPKQTGSISFTPYIWLTSLSGDVTLNRINFNANASFIDILQNTNGVFGLMGAVDLKFDRLVFQINSAWTYMKVENALGLPAGGALNSTIKIDSSWTELFAGYRFIDESLCKDAGQQGNIFVDGFVGGRLTTLYQDTVVTAIGAVVWPDNTPLPPGSSRAISGYQAWVEPFVGARVGVNLCNNWVLGLRGDVGGFGVAGDSFAWQAIGMVGYNWHMDGWTLSVLGGVRALSQNYTNGGFGWNEIVYGPAFGVQFSFAF